jgi:hypothetical protein
MEMELFAWIIGYLLNLLLCLWMVRWGGAEWLEGTFLSGFLVNIFAPRWNAGGIKLYIWLTLLISSVWFLLGLFWPEIRIF